MRKLILLLLAAYKRWISPQLPVSCRFTPTCSEYAAEAVTRHGALGGMLLGLWRLLRCHPLGGRGFDPVPEHFGFRCASSARGGPHALEPRRAYWRRPDAQVQDCETLTGGRGRADRHTTLSEFQNPQNQPGMDKRVIFIFVFTMALLLLAQQFLVKPQQRLNRQQAAKSAPAPAGTPVRPSAATAPLRPANRPVAAVQAASESTTVVENDLYRITFTNRGGLVKSWILKKYTDEKGQPLELVHAAGRLAVWLSAFAVDLG